MKLLFSAHDKGYQPKEKVLVSLLDEVESRVQGSLVRSLLMYRC